MVAKGVQARSPPSRHASLARLGCAGPEGGRGAAAEGLSEKGRAGQARPDGLSSGNPLFVERFAMASTVSRLPGKFVWFEHVSNDVAKARAFYGKLFGWHIESMPMGDQTYYMIQNGDTGIGGFRTAEPGMPSHWVSYVSVDNVDRSFKSAVANGAKSVLPPTDFGPVGRGAGVADPTGANFCLWTSAESDAPDVDKSRCGIFQSADANTPPMWLPYVHVEDCDASAAAAVKLGAKVFMPATDIP